MSPRPIRIRLLPVALIAAAAIGAGGGAVTYALLEDDPSSAQRQVVVAGSQPAATESSSPVSEIYRRAHKSVVEITVRQGGATGEGGGGQGSGFVYDRNGHVVTNQHVVAGADTVSVTFWNGAQYDARVVGSDSSTDLAVIDVDAPVSVLSPLTLGNSSKLRVGEGVVAIGSPYGLEQTITSGIVSALHRQMTAPNEFTINNSIQTDAAINHGNSGGPLLNLQGRVIGVNAQIRSDSGGNDGVGFAIPSNTVRSIAGQLISSGRVEHAYLGVAVTTIPASAAEELDVPAGVAVTQVRGGTPAARAGLRASSGFRTVTGQRYPTGGDVITSVDGQTVRVAAELQTAIDAKRAGETVSLTFTRDGESRTVQVKLATRPS